MAASQVIVEGYQDRVTVVSGRVQFEFFPRTGLYTIAFDDQGHVLTKAAVAFRMGKRVVHSGSYSTVKWRLLEVSDGLGEGKALLVFFGGKPGLPSLTADFSFYEGQDLVAIGLHVANMTGGPVGLNELLPLACRGKRGSLIFGSPRDCKVLRCNWAALDGQTQLCSLSSEDSVESANSLLFYDSRRAASLVGGILEPAKCLTSFHLSYRKEREDSMDFSIRQTPHTRPVFVETGGIVLQDGRSFSAGRVVIVYDGHPLGALEKYGRCVGKVNEVPQADYIPCGWCCRSHFAGGLTEERVLSYAEFVAGELKRYGFTGLLIDAGWQASRDSSGGPWNPRASFPNGMRSLVEKVHARGLKIGLWFRPLELESMRLDPSSQFAKKLLKKEASKFTQDWGFDFIKADLVDWDAFTREDRFIPEDESVTTNEAVRSAFQSLRDGLRPGALLLGMEAAFPASLGIVHAAGIARNVEAIRWQTVRESGLKAAALRYHLHGNLWLNDPGHLVIGKPATLAQARAWASLIALSGGCVFVGDSRISLSQKKLSIIKRVAPSFGKAARPVDLLEKEKPQVWVLEVKKDFGKWDVVGLFNWDPTPRESVERCREAVQRNMAILKQNDESEGIERSPIVHRRIASDNCEVRKENERIALVLESSGIAKARLAYLQPVRKLRKSPRFRNLRVSFRKLGLDSSVSYLVYDFWADAFLGEHRGSLTILVKLAGCRVLAFHPSLGRPQLLSTNRHLTQGGVELQELGWDDGQYELRGKSDLVAGDDYCVTVHVPRDYRFLEMKADCEEFNADTHLPRLVRLRFKNKRDKTITWRATFEKLL